MQCFMTAGASKDLFAVAEVDVTPYPLAPGKDTTVDIMFSSS